MTITTTARAGTSAWRVAIIGAVGALAVGMGVTLGSFLLTSRVTALGGGAAYVPADAPLYVEMRITPSEAQDAALREVLGRFPPIEGLDLDRPLADQLAERIDEIALAQSGTDVTWSKDIAPWFDGHVAVAVTDLSTAFTPPSGDMTMPEAPPAVLFVGVSDHAAAEASITRLVDLAGVQLAETQHAGFTIHAATGGNEPGAYALTDDQLVLGSDVEAVSVALDAHADASRSLAGAEQLADMAASLPSDWLAFASYDLTDAMAAALDAAESANPDSAELMRRLIESQPMRGAIAFSAAGDGLAFDAVSTAPIGPFSVENADRGLADEVPGDALYYSEAGNIGGSLAALIATIKEAAGQVPEGVQQLDTIESALGADLEELVSWIDDGALAVGWDGSQPYAGMVLVPNDVDAAKRRLDQLATFAGLGALDPSSGIAVDKEDVDGVTVTTIRWSGASGGGDMLMPVPTSLAVEFAVTDDRALIGVGDQFVRRALALDASDSLAADTRFTDAVAEVGGSDNAGVAWLDLAGIRTAVEDALGPMLESGEGAAYASEILPWLEPLDQFVSVSRVEGDLVVQHAALLVD